jgi:hypothetical protein
MEFIISGTQKVILDFRLNYNRWVLFPNEIPKSIVKGKEFKDPSDYDEAIVYFEKILPKIKEKEGKNLKIIEFIQRPGMKKIIIYLCR